jgi:hypothetical protein
VATATGYQVTGMAAWVGATDNSAFGKRLVRNVRRATKLNALAAVKTMRQTIQNGSFKANAPLTIALKGSSKPLVADGDMFQSITTEALNDDQIFVGVTRKEASFDVVSIVHDGATITVTPAMRWMFMLLAKASSGQMDPSKLEGRAAELFGKFQGWKPIGESTSAIVIPARPFATVTFSNPLLVKICRDNWEAAVLAAMYPPKKEPTSALEKTAKKLERKASKLSKKAAKAGKKAAKLGKKAAKAGKRVGKKAKRIGKKTLRSGKKATKRLARGAKRVGRKAKNFGKKAARSVKRGAKRLTKKKSGGRKGKKK